MTGRSVFVQATLAGVALVAAYFTWQRDPEQSLGDASVLNITRNDLDKVRYEDGETKMFAELTKGKDGAGAFVYLGISGHDATDAYMPAGHPAVILKAPDRVVRGSDVALRLFERFAPWRAVRALGKLDPNFLKELGLDTSKKAIEVTIRGQKRRFKIVPAPPGGTDPYVQDETDQRVYIIPAFILSDLQAAHTNLVDRRMHDFRVEDVDKVVLSDEKRRREFVASRFEEAPGIKLAPIEDAANQDQTARNWHERIWNMFPTEVLGKGEQPGSLAPAVAFRIEYFSRGKSLGFAEVARPGKSAASGGDNQIVTEVYARSELTAGWFKMPIDVLSLITEGESMLAKTKSN